MKLLVSVSSADEALAAVKGGADVIDAKDPSRGALGAVRLDVLSGIRGVVDSTRLVTAALGDAGDVYVEQLARDFAVRGAGLVKVGFAGFGDDDQVERAIMCVALAGASVSGACGVVAVGYADAATGESVDAMRLVSIAARSGALGVLIDTADKRGPGLTTLWSSVELAAWVAEVHAHGLVAAVAGKLTADDLSVVCDAGADIAGVRGAACVGGRNGFVSAENVRSLVARMGSSCDPEHWLSSRTQ